MSWITETLHKNQYRNSAVRNQIIETISDLDCRMFHAGELISALPQVDKVTVYRTLELLASHDIIHPTMQRDGVQYYELHGPKHHHHAMCTSCSVQECVACEVPEVPNKHHSIFYSFTCDNCA